MRRVHVGASLALALLAAACSEEECARGDSCEKDCPTGQVAMCLVDNICNCTFPPDGGVGGNGGGGGSSGGGGPGGGGNGSTCVAPAAGELLLNEVLFQGRMSDDEEFMELVNTSDHAVGLAGVKIVSVPEGTPEGTPDDAVRETRRAEFTAGCLAPRSAYAFFHLLGHEASEFSSPPIEAPAGELLRGAYTNDGDFDFRVLVGGSQLDRFAGDNTVKGAGVSANRNPDGQGPALGRHDAVSSIGLASSPGRCANGGTFEALCADPAPAPDGGVGGGQPPPGGAGGGGGHGGTGGTGGTEPPPLMCERQPPPLGAIVINEVNARPASEAEPEFIELVNTTDAPIVMDGWLIQSSGGDGALDDRVNITTATLPARGAVAITGKDPVKWIWDPMPAAPAVVGTGGRWSLVNDVDILRVRVADVARADVAILDVPQAVNVEGKSANRCHDLDGTTVELHDRVGAGISSPAFCANGRSFSQGCDAQ